MLVASRTSSIASRLGFPTYSAPRTTRAFRFSSSFPRQQSFIPFFTKARIPNHGFGRRLVWALPLAGGMLLYLAPRRPYLLSQVFSSPKLIPCPPQKNSASEIPLIIGCPDEENLTILSRILSYLQKRIWEPLLTARRFVHLLCIFVPVILSSPMLLVGEPEVRYKGDGWGAVWWYGQLVTAMERAGPTFVKASPKLFTLASCWYLLFCSWHSGLHLVQIYFRQSYVQRWVPCTQVANHTPLYIHVA